jgi:nitroreductase
VADREAPGAAPPPGARTPQTRAAPTAVPIHELLAGRWSPRAVDPDRPVPRRRLLSLFEAARWAPSSGNVQPWRFLLFDDEVPDAREAARDCLRRGNAWARAAPVLVVVLVRPCWPDSTDPNPSARHDTGAAALSLCLQASADGLIAHQMAGFDRTRVRERFAVPDAFEPASCIAIGLPGELTGLDERRLARETAPRTRRPVEQTVFVGGWDGPPLAP